MRKHISVTSEKTVKVQHVQGLKGGWEDNDAIVCLLKEFGPEVYQVQYESETEYDFDDLEIFDSEEYSKLDRIRFDEDGPLGYLGYDRYLIFANKQDADAWLDAFDKAIEDSN